MVILSPAILALLALAIVGNVTGWIWAIRALRRTGWRRNVAMFAVQLPPILFLFALLFGALGTGLVIALVPPLGLAILTEQVIHFQSFALAIAIWVAPVILVAFLALRRVPGLAGMSFAVSGMIGLLLALPMGERVSRNAMCQAAEMRGFHEFQRNSFSWSLSNAPQEFQFEIHALAVVDGQRLGWSYREMEWYVIPDDASAEVSGAVCKCPSRT